MIEVLDEDEGESPKWVRESLPQPQPRLRIRMQLACSDVCPNSPTGNSCGDATYHPREQRDVEAAEVAQCVLTSSPLLTATSPFLPGLLWHHCSFTSSNTWFLGLRRRARRKACLTNSNTLAARAHKPVRQDDSSRRWWCPQEEQRGESQGEGESRGRGRRACWRGENAATGWG